MQKHHVCNVSPKKSSKKRRQFATNSVETISYPCAKIKSTKLNLRCTTDHKLAKTESFRGNKITFMTSGLGKSVLAHSKQQL